MNVKLHIEKLVVDGASFAGSDGSKLQAAVQAELSRLIAREGISRAFHGGGAMPALRVTPIASNTTRNPSDFGTAIARAVHGGLKNPER